MIVQAVLLGVVALIVQSEYVLGTSLLSHPAVTGLFTGVVLDDVKTGIVVGATLELVFVGSFSVGASIPPDIVIGGILDMAFVITAGTGTETAFLLGLSTATLTLILRSIYLGLLIPIMSHKMDSYTEGGNYKRIEHVYLLAGSGLSLVLGIVIVVSYMVGSNTTENLLNKIPDSVQNGLPVAIGLIPALGFAVLTHLLTNKQAALYFFLGFTIASYLEIPVTGAAILGAILAVVVVNIMNVRRLLLQITIGEIEEGEEL